MRKRLKSTLRLMSLYEILKESSDEMPDEAKQVKGECSKDEDFEYFN